MQIHRFDDDYLIPITEHGSDFRIGPLTGESGPVQVSFMSLPAGGLIGRHPTVGRQLLCVVGGKGWVVGGDGLRRTIRSGEAACWEPGEEHETGSDGGMTAVCIEGEFDVLARSVLREIVVVDYDPQWAVWFEQVRAYVWPAVEDIALRIDHVGSTSVHGLAAKPIIDMDIVVPADDAVRPGIDRVKSLGYRWLGELGVVGRQAFMPAGPPPADFPPHHLYLVVEDNRAHLDHWLLRDLLRDDADARRQYGDLKRRNAEISGGDIDLYGQNKAELVAELLARARAERGLEPVEYWEPPRADEDEVSG
jgi:GrpB-like predicted nucleotidyltransferase (UPF0157 family)/quercetin dioxygenase-like cupin family protein